MSDDPAALAARLVADRFPQAHAAFLGGSSPTARRTPWSDLDIVVVLDGRPASFRETLRHDGQLVEWFVYTPTSLRHYWQQNISHRRTPLLRMVAEGVTLIEADGRAGAYRAEATELLAAGPPAPAADTLAFQRYLVTDLLDDLRGCADPVEIAFLAATLVLAASDLLLLAENRWSARGKWLPRRLAELDPALPAQLMSAQQSALTDGNREPLVTAILAILNHTGGPLQEGFRLEGEDPAAPSPPKARPTN
ncbi:nucleotidyltransferase domain-containing protein [Actinoplanes philippinensis]|uniref:nucleotidyltransferase domain-containing protein n=1 Tax=Actinoplanes philippinensis TaxID=35752 RepID=UPI001160A7E0|nr:nucleotidyltransferase domain-containing protein [Actinoplanes philippinensis]